MTHFTESTIEQAAIDWLQELGYNYAFGAEIAFDGDVFGKSAEQKFPAQVEESNSCNIE
jgi:hypothetical protein